VCLQIIQISDYSIHGLTLESFNSFSRKVFERRPSASHAEVSQIPKVELWNHLTWRTACVAWQKPDLENH